MESCRWIPTWHWKAPTGRGSPASGVADKGIWPFQNQQMNLTSGWNSYKEIQLLSAGALFLHFLSKCFLWPPNSVIWSFCLMM